LPTRRHGLIVVAKDVVDESRIDFEGLDAERSVILVQGPASAARQASPVRVDLEAVAVSASWFLDFVTNLR
jgi:hypothetical protein